MNARFMLLAVLGAAVAAGGYFAYDDARGVGGTRRAARAAYDRGDFVAAADLYDRYLAARPGDAEAHLMAARVARLSLSPDLPGEGGDAEPSPRAEDEARRRFEEHLSAYEQLGGSSDLERSLGRAQRGELGPVERQLQDLSREPGPDTVPVLEALSLGYLRVYRLAAALDSLGRWLEQEESVRALVLRGRVYERLRNGDAALSDYRRAVGLAPADPTARQGLAVLLSVTNRFDEAEEHFAALLALRPGNPAARLGLARCARARGRGDDARRALDELLAEYPDRVQALIERGTMAAEAGDTASAERLLRKALARSPGEPTALYTLARCLERLGRAGEAKEVAAQLRQSETDLERMGELTRQIAERPRDAGLRLEAGQLFLRNGHDREGLRWLSSALDADPRHRPTHAALSAYYDRVGNAALAEHHSRLARAAASPN